MQRVKVTYIVSDIDKALAFEWIASNLDKSKIDLEFILLTRQQTFLGEYLKEIDIPIKEIRFKPGWGLVWPFIRIWWHLLLNKPDVIHTHLRYGSLLGITAGFLAGVKTRIHTRHHSSFHRIYHPHAVSQDRFVSRLSTKIVAISQVVADTLIQEEKTPSSKVKIIPHGFDLSIFQNVSLHEIEILKIKYIPRHKGPIIGVVSRYIHWKGCTYIIQAFSQLLATYPDAHLILANAIGPDAKEVKEFLNVLPQSSYTEIQFETNISALFHLFDVYVHVPIDNHFEAFGQTYVEALAAGIPSVFTLSGIAREFIIHEKNALVVPFKDDIGIATAIDRLLTNKDLRNTLVENGKNSLKEFELDLFINRLETLYNG